MDVVDEARDNARVTAQAVAEAAERWDRAVRAAYEWPREVTAAHQIRAWAIDSACYAVGQSDVMYSGGTAAAVIDMAEQFAEFIATGQRPIHFEQETPDAD